MLKEKIIERFSRKPLLYLLLIGLSFRFLASIFSKGFLTLDDHFNFVVDADTIASGNQLPTDYKDSPLYPSFGALIMYTSRALGINSPDYEMFTIRFVQGLLSLFVIYFVYKILELKTDKTTAFLGGFLTSTLFIIPITAVHQFEEVICQVPLLASIWILIKREKLQVLNPFIILLSGLLMGVSLILRFPMISFIGIFTIGLIFSQQTRRFIIPFLFGIIFVALTQAVINTFINGEFGYSFKRNYGWILDNPCDLFHTSGYPEGPMWRYLFTLLGIFIPPFSFLFLFAAIKGSKIFSIIGASTLAFLIAHSIIANKQERFLLPIIPILIILGAAGFISIKNYVLRKRLQTLYGMFWIYFWILNSILLIATIFHYGKKDRVEPFVFIQKQHNATGILIAQYNYQFLIPDYYLGKPLPPMFIFNDKNNFSNDIENLNKSQIDINYLVLYSDSVETDRSLFEHALRKKFKLLKTFSPSLGDWIANFFNPKYNRIKTARLFIKEI